MSCGRNHLGALSTASEYPDGHRRSSIAMVITPSHHTSSWWPLKQVMQHCHGGQRRCITPCYRGRGSIAAIVDAVAPCLIAVAVEARHATSLRSLMMSHHALSPWPSKHRRGLRCYCSMPHRHGRQSCSTPRNAWSAVTATTTPSTQAIHHLRVVARSAKSRCPCSATLQYRHCRSHHQQPPLLATP